MSDTARNSSFKPGTTCIANIVLSGQIIPLRMFPDKAREIIYLTPIRFLVDFPVSIATGSIPIQMWFPNMFLALGWCLIMTFVGRLIYKSGIRVYGGFGA